MFATKSEEAKYRCDLKRNLRRNNILFDKTLPTEQLESLVRTYCKEE